MGFENDKIAEKFISDLRIENDSYDFVETGTYLGSTTLWAADEFQFGAVWTVEVNPKFFTEARKLLIRQKNVRNFFGDSPVVLTQSILPNLRHRPIIFLDAHWENVWPLRAELRILYAYRYLQPIIIIHDFKVPDHPELGYDTYKGIDLDWAFIKDHVWPELGTPLFNSAASEDSAKRGICYLGVHNVLS